MKKSEFSNVAASVRETAKRPPLEENKSYPSYRQGKKAIIFYGPPDLSDELKRMAIDRRCTMQDILLEAAQDVLRKYGRHGV